MPPTRRKAVALAARTGHRVWRPAARYGTRRAEQSKRSAGRGVMADRKAIAGLAKLVAKDVAAGHPGDNALYAARSLEGRPEAALDLVELALAEAAKKRPNQKLISAYAFLLGQTLATLRYRIEAGHSDARALADAVRGRLLAAGRHGEAEPTLLLLLLGEFGPAKLDPGDDLRELITGLLSQSAERVAGEPDAGQLTAYVADLVHAAQGNPFALFDQMQETGHAFPDDHRTAMAALLLHAGEPIAREAAMGWLMDPSPAVRERVARSLEQAAAQGLVTSTMLRRMITLRNWVPATGRPALDGAIHACRRRGVECAAWPEVQVREVLATGIDGSGAIGVLTVSREGRKHALGSLLLKHGVGIRDAWAQHGLTRGEADATLLQASGLDQIAVDVEFLRTAVSHFLAISLEGGVVVPFGLVDFMEAVGLHSVQPSLVPTASLLASIERSAAHAELEGAAVDRLLEAGHALPDEYVFVESWFEDGDEVRALLGGKGMSRAKREALVMQRLLEARRSRWADLLAWSAFLLSRADAEERWREFYAAARALVDGRPITAIPIMRHVAAQTVAAFAGRRQGS
jgi:hypothetical protein